MPIHLRNGYMLTFSPPGFGLKQLQGHAGVQQEFRPMGAGAQSCSHSHRTQGLRGLREKVKDAQLAGGKQNLGNKGPALSALGTALTPGSQWCVFRGLGTAVGKCHGRSLKNQTQNGHRNQKSHFSVWPQRLERGASERSLYTCVHGYTVGGQNMHFFVCIFMAKTCILVAKRALRTNGQTNYGPRTQWTMMQP